MGKDEKLTPRQRRMKRRRRRRRVFFALEIILVLILIAGLYVFAKLDRMDFGQLAPEKIGINKGVEDNHTLTGYTTIALVGLDKRNEENLSLTEGRSDTMIIASINNDTKEIKLLSIYRDTYLRIGVDEDGNGLYRKANAAYAKGGPEQLVSMLNTNLDLNISDVVSVDFKAVAKAAELLGGIDMEMTEEETVHVNSYCVSTAEETGMSYVPLEKVAGVHHLNGVQTVAYARNRATVGSDFRRAARQREVIKKLADKAKHSDLITLNNILDEVFPYVYTTLTKKDILEMGKSLLSYEIVGQAGYPFDHLYGSTVRENLESRTGGTDLDCVVPITLESNARKVHEFLFNEENYQPSEDLLLYSERIVENSGYGEESRPAVSETGDLESYLQVVNGTKSNNE